MQENLMAVAIGQEGLPWGCSMYLKCSYGQKNHTLFTLAPVRMVGMDLTCHQTHLHATHNHIDMWTLVKSSVIQINCAKP